MFTVVVNAPMGLGRVIRSREGRIIGIVEDRDVLTSQRKIKEVNAGCYVVRREILERYLPKIKKSKATGEYYFTDIVGLVAGDNGKIEGLRIKPEFWFGVNTPEEYKKAEEFMPRRKI